MKTLLGFLILPGFANCLNILFYVSVIAQSHIPFHNTAIKVLLDRGHTVVRNSHKSFLCKSDKKFNKYFLGSSNCAAKRNGKA